MGIYNTILGLLQQKRLSIATPMSGKLLVFGCIYKMSYSNWKHDPQPLIWVQCSDSKYTHGLNLNYALPQDKLWLANSIFLLKKGYQTMDGYTFYKFLKLNRPSLIKSCYRVYFTQMINQPKLVSAGITSLNGLCYPYQDQFIIALNKRIAPVELEATNVRVAYNPQELQERVIAATNATQINTMRVGQQSGIGTAAWVR